MMSTQEQTTIMPYINPDHAPLDRPGHGCERPRTESAV